MCYLRPGTDIAYIEVESEGDMRNAVIRELKKLGASECEAIALADKYPKTIARAEDLLSKPYYPAFQIVRAEDGEEDADIAD
ncbi:hypothetical protein LCGC14_2117430 [marine sediment metagenome]|uniref:Uncharacterized protein n=1 Tax=marine sediment metagenome TaxID=412755 RepID=A0A0F9ESA6_9ZZZZ